MTAPPAVPARPVQAPAPDPVSTRPRVVAPIRPVRRLLDDQLARFRRYAETSPGRIALIGTGLLLLIVLTGVSAAVGVGQRSAAMDRLVDQSEPRATAAQQLYGALSDADATSSRVFLRGALEEPEVRQRYDEAISRAQTALAVVARGSESGTATPLTQLATQLPVYVGLVETARANNRQGFPVGAAYLRDASRLMSERLLPAARELQRIESANQAADVDDADDFPFGVLLLLLVVLAGLGVAQRYLTKRTNRLLNVGMLAATGAVAVLLLWLTFAVAGQVGGLQDSVNRGTAQMGVLADASVAAREARADETLTLIARGDGGAYEQAHQEKMGELGDRASGLLATASDLVTDDEVRQRINSAIGNAGDWRAAHQNLRDADDDGNYNGAVQIAIGEEEGSAGGEFTALENDLAQAYGFAERAFNEEASSARSALTGLVGGIVVLTLIAAAGTAWGTWQRLREYL